MGSTLSIQSPNPTVPLSIRILPQWRDDAHLDLKQIFSKDSKEEEIDMKVDMSLDPAYFQMTSLGRKAPHAAVHIDWKQTRSPNETSSASLTAKSNTHKSGTENKESQLDLQESPAYGFVNTRDGCELNILPEDIFLEDDDDLNMNANANQASGNVNVPSILLTAKVPQQSNLVCHIAGIGNISIESKLEGDANIVSTQLGNISTNQLRGYNIHLQTNHGNITSTKNIEAQSIHLHVQQQGKVQAKMINGSNIQIDVPLQKHSEIKNNDGSVDTTTALVDISSLYTSHTGDGAHICMKAPEDATQFSTHPRHVKVKSHHGHVTVDTTHPPSHLDLPKIDPYDNPIPLIELGGMNGSCDMSIQPNATSDSSSTSTTPVSVTTAMAARVHIDSLSPNTISVLTANEGDIGITLDRKIDADFCLVSAPYISLLDMDQLLQNDNANDVHASMEQFESSISNESQSSMASDADAFTNIASKRIHMNTSSFTSLSALHTASVASSSKALKHVQYEYGQVSNQSQEPDSRFDVRTKGTASSKRGKINVENAALQALHGFTKQASPSPIFMDSSNNAHKSNPISDETRDITHDDDNDYKRLYEWPYLGVATSGKIQVETVNWLGAIARRYGMGESQRDKTMLGRQAQKSVK